MKINTKNKKGKSVKVFRRSNDFAEIQRAMKSKDLINQHRTENGLPKI